MVHVKLLEQRVKSGRNPRGRFRYLTPSKLWRIGGKTAPTLDDGNCDTMRCGSTGEWNGRSKKGESGEDKETSGVHCRKECKRYNAKKSQERRLVDPRRVRSAPQALNLWKG